MDVGLCNPCKGANTGELLKLKRDFRASGSVAKSAMEKGGGKR